MGFLFMVMEVWVALASFVFLFIVMGVRAELRICFSFHFHGDWERGWISGIRFLAALQ
jgi:hypothetical protein